MPAKPKTFRLEKHLEKALGLYCKEKGYLYYKFRSPSNRGVADRIIVTRLGKVIFLELKRAKEKPTDLQVAFIMKVLENNGNADWADSLERAIEIIES